MIYCLALASANKAMCIMGHISCLTSFCLGKKQGFLLEQTPPSVQNIAAKNGIATYMAGLCFKNIYLIFDAFFIWYLIFCHLIFDFCSFSI